MGLELYLDLMSPPCRSVYMFAKKNSIPFENKAVALGKGEHFSEEFGKVNCLRKVPALKDGDFTLAESVAILMYLAQKYKTPDHWYPSDLQKRARVDEFLSWQQTTISIHAGNVFLMKAMFPMIFGHPVPAEKFEAAVEDLNTSLKQFEDKFLQDKAFIAGGEISLADLVALIAIMQPAGAGHDIFEGRTQIAAWRQRVESEIGEELLNEANKMLMSAKDMAGTAIDPALKEAMKARFQKKFM